MAEVHCRHFNGYKPCTKGTKCAIDCPSYSRVGERILIIHLEALGAVLRSTSLLAAIRRKWPHSIITWVTKAPAHELLQNLPDVNRILTTSSEDLLRLRALQFDLTLVIDKSLLASGILAEVRTESVRGFRADPVNGAIFPANSEAYELWELGLSDEKKFFVNTKTEQQLVHEALALGEFTRDEYAVQLSEAELALVDVRRKQWRKGRAPTIGLNTGCSPTLPHKKLSVEGHRQLIEEILNDSVLGASSIVLLGGPEDMDRNERIAYGLPVIVSPTKRGLRDGLASVAACDLVFSGDSLGMHMAIGLKLWTVAWFGPSCAAEIDLYGRGQKILAPVPCSPCWKRVCAQSKMCYDQVDFGQIVAALKEGHQWLISSSKPHFRETSFSPSP